MRDKRGVTYLRSRAGMERGLRAKDEMLSFLRDDTFAKESEEEQCKEYCAKDAGFISVMSPK